MKKIYLSIAILLLVMAFTPDAFSQVVSTTKQTLNIGWYTIAQNIGNRASAKFSIRETRSSYHSSTHFYAQHHYGTDLSNQINVLANSYYAGNGAIRYIRIVEGSTYAGALLQVYIDINSTTGCYAEMTENIQESGWQIVDWAPATMTLPNGETGNVAVLVDLDINNGMIISHDLHVGNRLDVAGKIHAREIKVTTTAGADFVFEEDYNLRTLEETEQFIKANKHLPDIPSAKEMVENGITLGDMNVKLLQKIEELTLYVIELKKENTDLKQDNQEFQNRILKIENKLK